MNMPPKRKIRQLRELSIRDDFMFGVVFSNPVICKGFIEKLLDVKLSRVDVIERQKSLDDSYDYRSVRLDAYVEDEAGTVYNIEMQAASCGSLPMRARRYLSSIDRRLLEKGTMFDEAPPIYVIFVCDYDELGLGYALYERQCSYRGIPGSAYDDGTHVIFLNSHYTNEASRVNTNPEILEFLDYVRTADDSRDYSSPLMRSIVDEVQTVRSDEKWGVTYMTMSMKLQEVEAEARAAGLAEGRAQGIKEGRTEGRAQGKSEGHAEGKSEERARIIEMLHIKGFSPGDISSTIGIPLDEVNATLSNLKK